MKVKICGITNMEDARIAADLGADMIGFIFVASSPRSVHPDTVQAIINKLPSTVVPVGVFADASHNDIFQVIERTGIKCIQMHGNEAPEQLHGFPIPIIKSFCVGNDFDIQILQQYTASAFLLDTFVEGILGGSGKTFDWEIAVKAKYYGRIILAGGLSSGNILDAIQKVRPYAVDINSGVENAPGKKDRKKIEQLFNKIRQFQNKNDG